MVVNKKLEQDLREARRQFMDADIEMEAKKAEIARNQKELQVLQNNRNKFKTIVENLEKEDRPMEMSDHALLRFIQRKMGVDVDALRKSLLSQVPGIPNGNITIDGITFIVKNSTVVTVVNP